MKSFANFFEDIAARRAVLKQKQKDQAASFKEKGIAINQAAQERLAAQRKKQAENQERIDAAEAERKQREADRQAAKDELRQEVEQEKEDKKKEIDRKQMEKARAERED